MIEVTSEALPAAERWAIRTIQKKRRAQLQLAGPKGQLYDLRYQHGVYLRPVTEDHHES